MFLGTFYSPCTMLSTLCTSIPLDSCLIFEKLGVTLILYKRKQVGQVKQLAQSPRARRYLDWNSDSFLNYDQAYYCDFVFCKVNLLVR